MKKILFIDQTNSFESQVALSIATSLSEGKISIECAGRTPLQKVDPNTSSLLEDIGVKPLLNQPKCVVDAAVYYDAVIFIGCDSSLNNIECGLAETWEIPNFEPGDVQQMKFVRDVIESEVKILLAQNVN